MMHTLSPATLAAVFFAIAMAYAAVRDLGTMQIPNRLVLAIVLGFILMLPWSGLEFGRALFVIAVATFALAAGFALFALGWIGGGDAKLAAATVLWLGPELSLPYLALTAVIGGFLSIGILLLRRRMMLNATPAWCPPCLRSDQGVPYGVAMAAAALVLFPRSYWFQTIV